MLAATNLLEEGSTTGGDPVTTAGSITTVAGRLYMVTIVSSTVETIASVTLPGTITMAEAGNEIRGSVFRTSIWWGIASAGGTGTVSVDFSAATTGTIIIVDEFTGHDPSGTIVQVSAGANSTSGTATDALAAFADAVNNGGYMAVGLAAQSTISPEGTWTELGQGTHAAPVRQGLSAWRIGEDTSPSATFTATQWAIISVEIKAAAAAAPAFRQQAVLI